MSGFEFPSAPSPEVLAAFDLNDYGNGQRLITLVGGLIGADGAVDVSRATLLYQLGLGWVGFNGRFWDRKLGEQLARRAAHRVAQAVRGVRAELIGRGLTPKDVNTFVDGCGSRGSTSAMLAQAEPYLTVEIDDFDRDPLTVNCRNGTLHLKLGGPGGSGGLGVEIRPHDPADRITRFVDVAYDREARAPHFLATVKDSLPDAEVRGFFQRGLGYSSTGQTHEQAMFICQGLGRDGKSTLLDAVRETLGGYGAVGKVETFLDIGQRGGGDAAPDIVKLAGDVRLAVLSEPPRGQKLAEGLLKAWTSGSPISARELREKPFDFRPIAKLWMECNALPVAKGDDDGLWRRIHVILFERQVPEGLKPDGTPWVDKQLPAKLRGEKAGILNWLLEGVGDWLRRGLDPPPRVKKALEDYRKLSSPFGDWLNERCVWGRPAEGTRTLVGELHGDFKDWAEKQGQDKPMSQRAFGDALAQRQIVLAGKNSAGLKYRAPIRLKTPAELAEDAAAAEAAGENGPGSGRPGAGGGFELGPDDDDPFDPGFGPENGQ